MCEMTSTQRVVMKPTHFLPPILNDGLRRAKASLPSADLGRVPGIR